MYVEADGYAVSVDDGVRRGIHLPEPPVAETPCVLCGRGMLRPPCGRATAGGCAPTRPRWQIEPLCARAPEWSPARPPLRLGALRAGAAGTRRSPVGCARSACSDPAHSHAVPARLEPQRRRLLAGLLDTVGTVEPGGAVQVAFAERRLAHDVHELIVSLGYRCRLTPRRPPVGRRLVAAVHARSTTCSGSSASGWPTRSDGGTATVALEPPRTSSTCGRWPACRCAASASTTPTTCTSPGRSMIPTHNSTVSMDFARTASVRHNLASAIFSLEMSKIEIVTRLLVGRGQGAAARAALRPALR